MAYDKIVDSTALDTALTDIADAIRTKTGKTAPLTIEQMPSEIESISGGSFPMSMGGIKFGTGFGSNICTPPLFFLDRGVCLCYDELV